MKASDNNSIDGTNGETPGSKPHSEVEPKAPMREPNLEDQAPITEGPRGDQDPADGTDNPSIEAESRTKSNGNRYDGNQSPAKGEGRDGGAERGGPDIEKAQDRMPPDSVADAEL